VGDRSGNEVLSRAARLGRRVGITVFSVVVGGFTLVCAVQIFVQAWLAPVAVPLPECRATVTALGTALLRARADVADARGERATVERFRRALLPEWNLQAPAERACMSDRLASKALADLIQLRYAEEHAVRAQTADLLPLRTRVDLSLRDMASTGPLQPVEPR
jgi:hypothetical protein